MSKKTEYYNVFGWSSKKKTKIGYAFKTDRGTFRIQANKMLDATKLGRLLQSGIEIEKRMPRAAANTDERPAKKDDYQSYADSMDIRSEYAKTAKAVV